MAIRVEQPVREATTKMTSYETTRDEGGLGGPGDWRVRFHQMTIIQLIGIHGRGGENQKGKLLPSGGQGFL